MINCSYIQIQQAPLVSGLFEVVIGAMGVDLIIGNIAFLEFYLIVLSLYLWGAQMQNRCILFFTDNEALVKFSINNHVKTSLSCSLSVS